MAITTSSTLSPTIKSFYEKKFLMVAEKELVFEQLGMQGRVPKQEGKTVVWTQMKNLAVANTALTEGTDPTPVGLSALNVTATLTQYGNLEYLSDLVTLTAIDNTVEEAIDRLAYNAAETIDTVVRDVVVAGGQVLYGGTATARNSLQPTDEFGVAEIRKGLRTLRNLQAKPHSNGDFAAVIHPYVEYDLQGDTSWVNAHIYTEKGINAVFNGESGKMYGTRFIMSQNAPVLTNSGSAGTEVYQTMIFGKGAFGVSKIHNLETYVDSPSPRSALRLRTDVGWKANFATAVLNDSFMVRYETGATQ